MELLSVFIEILTAFHDKMALINELTTFLKTQCLIETDKNSNCQKTDGIYKKIDSISG